MGSTRFISTSLYKEKMGKGEPLWKSMFHRTNLFKLQNSPRKLLEENKTRCSCRHKSHHQYLPCCLRHPIFSTAPRRVTRRALSLAVPATMTTTTEPTGLPLALLRLATGIEALMAIGELVVTQAQETPSDRCEVELG